MCWLQSDYWMKNHRMVVVGRDLWRSSSPTPLLKHVQCIVFLERGCKISSEGQLLRMLRTRPSAPTLDLK